MPVTTMSLSSGVGGRIGRRIVSLGDGFGLGGIDLGQSRRCGEGEDGGGRRAQDECLQAH